MFGDSFPRKLVRRIMSLRSLSLKNTTFADEEKLGEG
jgi:hypothetical protein